MGNKTQTKPASTQQHLAIAEIRDGILILKSGGLRQILLATSLNFALKSETEQNAIVGGYQNFLNSLHFPIQIVMASRQLDLTGYIKKLAEKKNEVENPLLSYQMENYIDYISKLIEMANVMDKRFYVVVPYNPTNLPKLSFMQKVFKPGSYYGKVMSKETFENYIKELTERVNTVKSGLSNIGIRTQPLNTQQVIELFYGIYNPEEAVTEKLTKAEALVEEGKQPTEGPVAEKPEDLSADLSTVAPSGAKVETQRVKAEAAPPPEEPAPAPLMEEPAPAPIQPPREPEQPPVPPQEPPEPPAAQTPLPTEPSPAETPTETPTPENQPPAETTGEEPTPENQPPTEGPVISPEEIEKIQKNQGAANG
jgi:hypothetical protein